MGSLREGENRTTKVKVTISLNIDVLEALDRYAETEFDGNRSMAIQQIIRRYPAVACKLRAVTGK